MPEQATTQQKTFHMAIASLVFSILGIIIGFFSYLTLLVGIYAIFKIKNHHELKGTGLAIAGVAIAAVTILI